MKQFIKQFYIITFLFLLSSTYAIAQEERLNKEPEYIIEGTVKESDSHKPIPRVNVEIVGGDYTTTNIFGEFSIKAFRGDELIIKHYDFETVYYTVYNSDNIVIEVKSNEKQDSKFKYSKRVPVINFKSLLDSVENYLKIDAKKSIQFVAEALTKSDSSKQNAEAYEILADVYMYWEQYDLSITNYRISLQNLTSNQVKLKLAKAYELNNNYQESIESYKDINKKELSSLELTTFFEGLGDVHFLTKEFQLSIDAYKTGLQIALKNDIISKITDLNSKLAQVYDASGQNDEAEDYFENSLSLATQENSKRAVEEKVKVADFQNKNKAYDDEIELRKEALNDIISIQNDSVIDNESALTAQKQNYKIGNAYYLQRDYDNAIPYLEKSIVEADNKEDLIVQKDATKKLSEVYRDAGEFDKALATYKDYENIVDRLYSKKEQEISQAARFSRDIADKQNRITSLETDRELSESKYELTAEKNKRQQLIIYSLIGGLILLLAAAYFMFKNIKQQKLNNNLLALKSLRSQMNPHFIFNALNSVNSFIATSDERSANKYLSDFSLLMRAVLENSEEDFIPLKKEIELLELYTKLEHFRFQDKFDYLIDLDKDVDVNAFQIPPMLLQPYIENAVWHGLRYKKSIGFLSIHIGQQNMDELTITISDNGIGRKKSKALKTKNQQRQNSKGMGNIKKRVAILNEMYKDKVDVFIDDFQENEDTGTKVVVTLKKD